jgi:hypothetical protein
MALKPKILLHVCCAVCGTLMVKILRERFEPIVFNSNSNIHPEEEYRKRLEAVKKLASENQTEFIEDRYDPPAWYEAVSGLEKEPEGGKRCPVCFALRLGKTAAEAKRLDIRFFTTTLSASPHKNEHDIDRLGKMIAEETGTEFVAFSEICSDKKDSWRKTSEMSRKAGFYRQKYCGCEFSNQPRN